MSKIKLPDSQKYGAVGCPMVQTTLAGIELLGTLTAHRFGNQDGEKRFREFGREFTYPPIPRKATTLPHPIHRV